MLKIFVETLGNIMNVIKRNQPKASLALLLAPLIFKYLTTNMLNIPKMNGPRVITTSVLWKSLVVMHPRGIRFRKSRLTIVLMKLVNLEKAGGKFRSKPAMKFGWHG